MKLPKGIEAGGTVANRNPVDARLRRRRRSKPGNLKSLVRAVWCTLRDAELSLVEATTVAERCSAVHAMASIAGVYVKLIQVGEYEARLARLEQFMEVSAHGALLPTDAHTAGGAGDADAAGD